MNLTNHSAIITWLAAVTLVPSVALSFSGDSLLAKWSHLITSSINSSSDQPMIVTTDAVGNTIVAGRSEGVGSAFDILTVKYDEQGRVVWSRRYDGWHHGFDIPNAVAVDSEGNVLVAGTSDGADSSDSDIVMLKYSSTGEMEWVARYDGPAIYIQGERYGSADVASDLAIDENDNALVCGMRSGLHPGGTYGPAVSRDILTLKYSPDGTEEWSNVFDGTFHHDDFAAAIAVDTEGNAVVTGWVSDSTSTSNWAGQNMIIIKFSAYGDELWNVRHQKQEADCSMLGKDIVVGMDGSVVVTGELNIWYSYPFDSRHDIVTVKYSSEGVLQWEDVFDAAEIPLMPYSPREFASELTMDMQGNVYVAGSVSFRAWDSNPDSILTIKYLPSGARSWVRYFSKGSNRDILSGGVVSGPEGTVFVLGFKCDNTLWADSTVLIRYDSAGNVDWVRATAVSYWEPPSTGGLAVDGFGNSVVIIPKEFGAWSDFALKSYSMQGGDRWAAETDAGASCVSFVRDVVADSIGNTIVTGAVVDSTGKRDFFTAKYDQSGTQLWYSTFGGVPGGDDGAFAVTLDQDGNIYVAGCSEGLQDDTDFMTIKYNSSGEEEWSERFHSSRYDCAYHVQVDADGNVLVSGFPSLVKYDPDGLLLWSVNTGPVASMSLIDSGSILITNQGEEYLRKYDENGGLVWSVFSEAVDVVSSDDGFVYATWGLGTTKYDESGGIVWHKPAEGGNWVKIIGGRVIIGGYDSLFVLTEGGVVEWRRPGLPGWIRDGGVAAVGTDGSIYLAGMELDNGYSTGRLHVVQYSADGDLLRTGLYDDMGRGEFRPFFISPDADGDVMVVGEKTGRDFSTMPFLLKLSGDGLLITGVSDGSIPGDFALLQNYPNPFNAQTTLGFEIGDLGYVKLEIFDPIGRRVATVVDEELAPGSYTRRWDATGVASGVYFYRLHAGNFSETRKLILLR